MPAAARKRDHTIHHVSTAITTRMTTHRTTIKSSHSRALPMVSLRRIRGLSSSAGMARAEGIMAFSG
jgi:hypothetical protein